MENIAGNNKLIAEFMGLSYCEKYKFEGWYTNHEHNYRICNFDDLKYHTDWNWLMEVVGKIESLGFRVTMVKHICRIEKEINSEIVISENLTKIQAVYLACLEFIKWYDLNNK